MQRLLVGLSRLEGKLKKYYLSHHICVRRGQSFLAKGCSQIGGVRLIARVDLLSQTCLDQSDCIQLANPVIPPLISMEILGTKGA